MFVFSPNCVHCRRNWPAWLEIARGAGQKRVVFVNVGEPLAPEFLRTHNFVSATVVAKADAQSILSYSLFEVPITLLISDKGRSERVWAGEVDKSRIDDIKRAIGWRWP